MRFEFPFPPPHLNPNRAGGKSWRTTRPSAQNLKHTWAWLAKKAIGPVPPTFGAAEVPLTITFVMPDRHRRDRDNLLASCKSGLDGLAAMLGIDDNQFEPLVIRRQYGTPATSRTIVEVGA